MEGDGGAPATDGPPAQSVDESGIVPVAGRSTWRRVLRRAWPAIRVVIGFAVVVVAVWVLSSKGSELEGFTSVFGTLRWWWVPPAFALEIGSYVCFALMQRDLLMAGHLRPPWWTLLKLTFGSQALTNSLPIGNAVATVYGFRWFRRFGADNTLAVWAMAGTLVASVLSLTLVAMIGLGLATGAGSSYDLVPVLIGAFLFALALGSLFVYERPMRTVITGVVRASVKLTGRPRGDTHEQIRQAMAWLTAIRLTWTQIGHIVWWGTLNWLLDCACFALMFKALGAPIPWGGLLLAYGAGQLAATLPITPGGLGVVEGSITLALVAFGGQETSTAYAVLLYRVISFWFILALGWLFIGEMALQVRRGHWRRSATGTAVEAGPEAYGPPAGRPAGDGDGDGDGDGAGVGGPGSAPAVSGSGSGSAREGEAMA